MSWAPELGEAVTRRVASVRPLLGGAVVEPDEQLEEVGHAYPDSP